MQVEVLPSIAEFVLSTGEVGRSAAHLLRDFPQVRTSIQFVCM